jgi:hypothetical protein
LLVTVSLIGWIYIRSNRQTILKRLTAQINSRIRGQVSIEGVDASLFHHFSMLSIKLYNVSLRDSLWKTHRHTLLEAGQVFADLNLFSLITGHVSVSRLSVENSVAYLFTDSLGYSNTDILRPAEAGADKNKNDSWDLPDLFLSDLKLTVERKDKNKFFHFDVKSLQCVITKTPQGNLDCRINLDARIGAMAFNLSNGSFLTDKQVSGKFVLDFNPKSKILHFENIALLIDQNEFTCTGKFFLDIAPLAFTFTATTPRILLSQAASLVSPNIRVKLDLYKIDKPVSITASIDGTDPDYPSLPLVHLKMVGDEDSVTTPLGVFAQARIRGTFTNQWNRAQVRGDQNSQLQFISFSSSWNDIQLASDTVAISNLLDPQLHCDLRCSLDLVKLNDLSDSSDIQFMKGTGRADLICDGPLTTSDSNSMARKLQGNLQMDSASLLFQKRNFLLSDGYGKVRLVNGDLFIDTLRAKAGGSDLLISGSLKNFDPLSVPSQTKPSLVCLMTSPRLNLADFTSLLSSKPAAGGKTAKKEMSIRTVSNMESTLNACDMHWQIKAKQLVYKKFMATNLSAGADLSGQAILLNHVFVTHAGGSLSLDGSIQKGSTDNQFSLHATLNKVDISKVFTAFNNFGQKGIADKNLSGKLDATVEVKGLISEQAQLLPGSLKGDLFIHITDGELIQFEPLEKISEVVFKNRDFSDVHFADLQDKLEINGSEIKINRMEINSSAFDMVVQGVYDLDKGSDLSIAFPLSNLKNKSASLPVAGAEKAKIGPSIHLRARKGSDGKLKITWDPFQKALKQNKSESKK